MQTAPQTIMGHFGSLPHLLTQQVNHLVNVRKRPRNLIILHECSKNHTHMAYSYKEMMRTSVQAIQDPLCPFHTFWPKKSKISKNKKRYLEIIVLHQCTKNHNYMIFNLQTMMWIALQVILGHFCLLPNFWPRKSKFLKKRKKARGYIIILLLHSKNHNHLMYSSLKMMPTALQVILGHFLLFYSIFGPK